MTTDITHPPRQRLNDSIQALVLVNRAADIRYTDDPADSIQLQFYKQAFRLDTVINDLHTTDTLLQSLALLLFESGRFDVVIPEERFLLRDTLLQVTDTMQWSEAEELTRRFNVDAVLSLEHYANVISTIFYRGYDYSVSPETELRIAEMAIARTAFFRVYFPANKTREGFLISDTLLWEDADVETTQLFTRFTPVKEALAQSGIEAALQLASIITPVWKPAKRAYFHRGHRLLKEASGAVMADDWEKAAGLWYELAQKEGRRNVKSRAEFNMALAWELRGDLDEAIRWGLRSYQRQYRKLTWDYLDTLRKRKTLLSGDGKKDL